MGLKTTNYQVAETGVVLPTAVAIVTNIDRLTNKATLGIAVSRENALKGLFVKKVDILDCKFDFSADLATQAYETATKPKIEMRPDEETGEEKEYKVLPYFHNWQDDRV
jgi:hypothetical protein